MEAVLEQEGFAVKAFFNPSEAWDAFQKEEPKPSVLITDFVMQPFNGLELLARCRHLSPGIRSVVVSGNVGADALMRHDEKPDAFVAKPFLPDRLVAEVNTVLERQDAA